MKPSSPVLVRGCALSLLVGLAIAFPGASAFAATPDLDAIRQQVEAQHDEAVKRLQDWIAMPSIAAEDLNSREGAQYMAQLARDAGFQKVEIIDTDGKPRSEEHTSELQSLMRISYADFCLKKK